MRVRLAAELVEAAAEHLRLRLELDVTLDADDGFVLRYARDSRQCGLVRARVIGRALVRMRRAEQQPLGEERRRRAAGRSAADGSRRRA